MKKSILFIVILAIVFGKYLLAQNENTSIEKRWKSVEEFAEKQLPESALKEVESILTQAQAEKKSTEIVKAMLYKMRFILEKNPDEAATLIHDFEAFTDNNTDPAESALLHCMTADLYVQFYQKDQWTINRRTELKGFVPEDIKEWTKNIYFDKISKHLAASLQNPDVLKKTDALKFTTLLQIGNDSRTLQPTLFDFLSYRKISILQQIELTTAVKNPLNDNQLFGDIPRLSTLKIDSTYKSSIENPILETYQQLLGFRLSEKNTLALIFADLHFLRYLKQHSSNVEVDSLYLSALNRLKKQYFENEAVVEVYAELANYYKENSYLEELKSNKNVAYNLCEEGMKRFPKYNRIGLLENMQHDITRSYLSINYNQVIKPTANLKVRISSGNISVMKLSVYKVNASAQDYYSYKQKTGNPKAVFKNSTLLETRLIEIKPDANYGNVETEILIKTANYGIYEFTLAPNDNNDESQCAIGNFTVSDLAFMVRKSSAEISDMYVLNRNSGKPQSKVNVNRYNNKWAGNGYEIQLVDQLISDKSGLCQFPSEKNIYNEVFFFEKGDDKFFSSSSSTYFYPQNFSINKNVRVNIITDRSIYRPGQTVFFKGIAFYSNKTRQEIESGKEYDVILFDENNQKVSTKTLKTNEFGSFAGEFVLPEGGLNGSYRIQADKFSQNILVEEYKRPTFEVTLEKPKSEVNFGDKTTLTGNVKAYAGYNVGEAMVKYRVVRRSHRYWWRWSEPEKAINNGTTTSKSDGTFEIIFVAEKSKNQTTSFFDDQFYSYTIYADVTDLKGETQQGEQTISVGDKSLFILAEVAEKVDKKQTLKIAISTETLNGEKLNSTIKYSLYRLEETEIFAENLDKNLILKDAEKVLTGSFDTKNLMLNMNLNKFVSGRYKMVFSTTDNHGKEVKLEKIFVLYGLDDKHLPVKCYEWIMTPKTECEVGEKAQIYFGTSTKNSMVLYEVMLGNLKLESRWIEISDEIKTFEFPFKESYGTGVTVVFTFMKDEKFFTKQVQITRKITQKKLTPTLSVFRNKLQPGEKTEWTVTIPETVSNKAELLVDMYDASLDKLRPNYWRFNPTYRAVVLNSPRWISNGFNAGSDIVNVNYYVQKYVPDFITDQLNWFGLNMNSRKTFIVRGASSMNKSILSGSTSIVAQENSSSLNEMVVVGYGSQKKIDMTGSIAGISDSKAGDMVFQQIENLPAPAPIKTRTNFNETAFFYPQLRTDALGNVKFTFTAPESLTRWNVKMLAHTADLYFGQNQAQVVTQKDLMVQMNLPRFVRRSDKLLLSTNVINLSDKELTAKVQFEMIDPATEKIIFTTATAPLSSRRVVSGEVVTLAANETKAVQWEISDFSAYELVICKVVAQAGNFSDGEQKYLPILPDKVLITESLPLTIRGNQTRIFNFESLLTNGANVTTKNLTVEFSSNPAWYAVQALPTISQPDNDNAFDYFTAFYANSLAAFIANSNPKIAATFDRWKKAGGSREALLSNLEKNKELKNMLLEETPWVMAAKDETEQKRQIALLFDLNMQKNQSQQYLEKLESLQLPSGGFSWFKGMPESRYITQEIILNFARLKRLTGTLSCQHSTINKAINFLDLEIARDFENLKKYSKNYENEMSIDNMQLLYLHLRSEYPEIPIQVSAQAAVKFYTGQAQKYWTNFSLYGKASMAIVASRNGKIQIANEIIKSLKENALKTDELGMYWAKNTSGFFWSERPIATQAAIIDAFAEVNKNIADIDEMKIWLLKQKQTQRWDSPMSTVDAIYALLCQGNNWLANESTVSIKLASTLLDTKNAEAGTGYFKKTIPADNFRPEMGKVTVSTTNVGSSASKRNFNKSSIGWGAVYWQYYQDLDKVEGQSGSLRISKKLFVEKMTSSVKSIIPIEQTKLAKGDKVITRLVITTDRNLEFVALKDLRAACFEPVKQLSGCDWKEGVCYYQTTKDASTQYFFSFLPKGTYVFEYELWVNNSGEFTSGIASVQCQYAPEFVSHSGGEKITVH
jgi:hypothetical protein